MPAAIERIWVWAQRRLPALTRYRNRENLPITLHRRRIYLLPTRFGLGFALLLLIMLIGALNYANNAALLLTCLLGGACLTSMLLGFRSLNGLCLLAVRQGNAMAGEPLLLQLTFAGDDHAHPSVQVDVGPCNGAFAVAGNGQTVIDLPLTTTRRGWQPLPRIRLWTHWPLGLFHVWSWVYPDQSVLVWPRPEAAGPPPSWPDGHEQRQHQHSGEDIAALRDYRAGDPRRHIAWKASARHQNLLVKDFEQPASHRTWQLDWRQLPHLLPEARIARLARWLGQAHAQGHPCGLWLPNEVIELGQGHAHYARCMNALARLP